MHGGQSCVRCRLSTIFQWSPKWRKLQRLMDGSYHSTGELQESSPPFLLASSVKCVNVNVRPVATTNPLYWPCPPPYGGTERSSWLVPHSAHLQKRPLGKHYFLAMNTRLCSANLITAEIVSILEWIRCLIIKIFYPSFIEGKNPNGLICIEICIIFYIQVAFCFEKRTSAASLS